MTTSVQSTTAGNPEDSTDTGTNIDTARVEHMLRLAKSKSELQDLVRSLDAANVRLRHTIRRLTTPGSEQDPHE